MRVELVTRRYLVQLLNASTLVLYEFVIERHYLDDGAYTETIVEAKFINDSPTIH